MNPLPPSNNLYGNIKGLGSIESFAIMFEESGLVRRKSSWTEFEVKCSWCELELAVDLDDILIYGAIIPTAFNQLKTLLIHFGCEGNLELYNEEHELIEEYPLTK